MLPMMPMKTMARDEDRVEIFGRLRALRRDSARRWGRMSAHQMVCHLCDACRIPTGDRPAELVPVPVPRLVIKSFALYVPVPWPRDIRTTRELDQNAGGTAPREFDADVAELTALLTRITVDLRGRLDGRVHPAFGSMSEPEWLRWAYLHADHHFRQFGV